MRKIRIDLGVEITFEDHIRIYPRIPDKGKNSVEITDDYAVKKGVHAAIGRIKYSTMDEQDKELEDGMLIYIKPAIYGDEPRDVLHYAKAHPDFPHESTTDQFFSESQFESYRKLGCYTIDTICGEERKELKQTEFVQKAIAHAYEEPSTTRQWFPAWLNRRLF